MSLSIERNKIPGYRGTWYVIGSALYRGDVYYLLESEEEGDELPSLIATYAGQVILDDVRNGFLDLALHLDTECVTASEIEDEMYIYRQDEEMVYYALELNDISYSLDVYKNLSNTPDAALVGFISLAEQDFVVLVED